MFYDYDMRMPCNLSALFVLHIKFSIVPVGSYYRSVPSNFSPTLLWK